MSSTSIPPLGGPSPAGDTFKVYTLKSDVRFLSKAVQPPSQVYVDPNDVMQVGCATSQGNEVVTVSYRLLRADGELILGQFQIFPANTRAIATRQEPLAEGFLLSVSCSAAVATTRGQTFVRIFLTDQSLGSGQPSYMLMADYVTNAMAPAYPNGRILAPSEGPGWPRTIVLPPPGAGINWSLLSPINARWAIRSVDFNYTTDAVAGARLMALVLLSGGSSVWIGSAPTSQPPSSVFAYGAATLTPWSTPSAFNIQLALPPGLFLLNGGEIASSVENSNIADSFGGINVAVEEWLDNV